MARVRLLLPQCDRALPLRCEGQECPTPDPGRSQTNLIASRKREHSRKPDEYYPIIDTSGPSAYFGLGIPKSCDVSLLRLEGRRSEQMVAIAITRMDLTAAELRASAAKSRDAQAARRMLALALVLEGVDRKSAAETCGMDRQTSGTGCIATMQRGWPGSRTTGARRGRDGHPG